MFRIVKELILVTWQSGLIVEFQSITNFTKQMKCPHLLPTLILVEYQNR